MYKQVYYGKEHAITQKVNKPPPRVCYPKILCSFLGKKLKVFYWKKEETKSTCICIERTLSTIVQWEVTIVQAINQEFNITTT